MDKKLKILLKRMKELTQELEEVRKEIEACYAEIEKEVPDSSIHKDREEEQPSQKKEKIQYKEKEIEAKADQGEIKIQEEESILNPQVLEFLDLESFTEKLDYLMHKLEGEELNEQDLDIMAVSVDIVLEETDREGKLEDLIRCLSRLASWEIQGSRRSYK